MVWAIFARRDISMVTSFLTRRQALGGDDQFPVGVNPPKLQRWV
jgi:hypothetical protein